MFLYNVGRSVFAIITAVCLGSAALSQVPAAQHVVLVIDENSSFSDVIANMPWLVGQGYANGYATHYESDNGGSLLDYLWLASGSCESAANCTLPPGTHDFNCNGNDCYYPGTTTSDPITDDNIFRELNNRGIPWKVYAQSYEAAGGTVTTPDNNNGTSYYRRHNGATWYSDVLSNVAGSANKVVDLSQLTTDLAADNLPRFMIIVPDGNHDAHDCPLGMSTCTEAQQLAAADAFLHGTLDAILSTPDFQPGGTGLILVTFDECGGGTNQGCGAAVYTALIGPQVTPHTVSSLPYKHENALRTILDSLDITTYPGAAARAADMWDFFAVTGSKPEVVVSSPANAAALSSPITIQASAFPTSGHSIGGWWVYVDSVGKYNAGNVDSIRPKISMSTGTHTVVVRAWDNSGAYGDQTFEVTVASPKPTVTVSTPTNRATVGSPVNIQASASPTAGQTIGGWWIYVDGVGVYNAGSVNAINANIAIGPGTHTVIIRAWDTSTAYGDQTWRLTVANKPAVAVSTPTFGSNVISPLNIAASAQPSSGHSISGWRIYLDGVGVYQAGPANTINANVSTFRGTHTLLVRAWDSSGAFGDQSFTVNVQPLAVNIKTPANTAPETSPVNLVASAVSANAITGWQIYVDSDDAYTQDFGDLVDASLPMAPGTHTVVVRAWDRSGAYGEQTITVTVP
jgi:Phosphoesterase family